MNCGDVVVGVGVDYDDVKFFGYDNFFYLYVCRFVCECDFVEWVDVVRFGL